MEGISSQQLQHTLNLLHIGPDSLIDADVFCSLCALSERIFYSKYSFVFIELCTTYIKILTLRINFIILYTNNVFFMS